MSESKRIVCLGDVVTVEHPTVLGDPMVQETFKIGRPEDPTRKPIPVYGPDHLWSQAVLGKAVGSTVILPTREENVTEATILKASLPEHIEY